MKRLLIVLILLLISGCRRPNVDREFAQLKQRAQEQTHSTIKWNKTDERLIKDITVSISRKQAVSTALENNMELQAAFEDLGIAKADLVQAGFFSNPHIDTLFRLPDSKKTEAQIEVAGSMNIADFWLVPMRTALASSDLKIMSFALLRLIIETTTAVKMAYDTCLYQQELTLLTQNILHKVQELRERIAYRQQFGYESDLNRYYAIVMAGKWETRLIEQKAQLKIAYAHLRRLLSINVSSESIALTDSLTYEKLNMPSVSALEAIGQKNRTPLQISQLEIEKAHRELSLQKARIMNKVNFGFCYERDFEGSRGWGPTIGFDLPLFDQNLAQISRAKFLIHKAKKAYKAEKLRMLDEIYHSYEHAQALKQEIIIFKETMIPASEKGITYSNKFFNRMQLNMLILLEAQVALYEIQEMHLNKQYQLALTFAQLERSIGKVLS
jgi:outer membrane protein, heavy metal efflux system